MANDTAPADWAKTEKEWAAAAQNATGSIEMTSSKVMEGKLRRSGANQVKRAYTTPTPS